METLYRKVSVSNIEKYKWYLRDTEDGYFDMFYCLKIEDKVISGIGIINNEIDNDLEFEKHYFISDFFELIEIPNPTTQLQEEIETLVECDIPTVMSNYGKADGTRESSINYNEGHQTSWKKGFKKALELTNPSIAQLQSDRKELLEMLEDIQDELENGDTPKVYKIEELIQKHKQ